MKASLKLAAGLVVIVSVAFVVRSTAAENISPRLRATKPLQKKPTTADKDKAEENFVPEGAPSCKKMVLVMAKRMLPVLRVCSSAIKEQFPDPQEFAKRQSCPLKCFMFKTEMVNPEGQFTNASITVFFDKHIPDSYRTVGYKVLGPCLEEFGDGKINVKDETCADYGKVLQCMQHKGLEHCGM